MIRFGTESKFKKLKNETPGVGQYDTFVKPNLSNNLTFKKAKDKSVDNKNKELNLGPGPGRYNIKDFNKSVSFSIEGKAKEIKKDNFPGPGQYDVEKHKSLSNLKLDGKGGILNNKTKRELNLTLHTSISLTNNNLSTPGPGRYNTNINYLDKSSKNKFKFSTDKKYHYKTNHNPGPGAYLETDINTKHNNAVIFSKTERKSNFNTKDNSNNTVGPGRYNVNNDFVDAKKKISIGSKLKEEKRFNTPGPGAYENLKSSFNNSDSPNKGNKGIMNSKIKRDMTIKISDNEVGPGRYKVNDSFCTKKVTNQFKFSNDTRFKKDKNEIPGPGQYKIPCSIRDVTGYNETGGNFDPVFKFV